MRKHPVFVVTTLAAVASMPAAPLTLHHEEFAITAGASMTGRPGVDAPDEHVHAADRGFMGFVDLNVPSVTGGSGISFVRLAADLSEPK